MDAVKLPGLAAAVAERRQHFQGVAAQNADFLVHAVYLVDVRLLRIVRERHVPHRSRANGLRLEERFLHERAVGPEHLHAIVDAIADVDELILRDDDAVDRPELLRGRRRWIVIPDTGVIGFRAVGAPVALVLAGIGVENDDAAIAVAVGDVGLVGRGIDEDLRRPPQMFRVVAAFVDALSADLQEELAVAGELQDVRVLLLVVAADPDVAFVIDREAMVVRGPLVAVPRTTPVPEQVACLIELEHGRRRRAAASHLWGDGRGLEIVVHGVRPVQDPDVILVVDRDADRHAEHPVIGERLRPQRIDFEVGRFRCWTSGGSRLWRCVRRCRLPAAAGGCRDTEREDECCADHRAAFSNPSVNSMTVPQGSVMTARSTSPNARSRARGVVRLMLFAGRVPTNSFRPRTSNPTWSTARPAVPTSVSFGSQRKKLSM